MVVALWRKDASCGVREDVDARAMAAIRQWRFEPARLGHSTPPGLPIPAVMTVTLQIGQ